MEEDIAEWYDTCDYPPSHSCFSKQNAKRLRIFKDEFNRVPILEFIGLRAKMYDIHLEMKQKDNHHLDMGLLL